MNSLLAEQGSEMVGGGPLAICDMIFAGGRCERGADPVDSSE
jgi:hypothetical protein